MIPALDRISEHLYVYPDTCNVYVIVLPNEEALLIDFGSGDVLDHMGSIGVARVIGVLMTHHHRDQGQGLPRAAEAGIPIWVPHTEQDLFRQVEEHWQARELSNNYNMRQDNFSIVSSVQIAGTLKDYKTFECGGIAFEIVPTPGHTIGSITLMTRLDGRSVAFTGDLLYAPGKVWSLAATQWGYNDVMGVYACVLSLYELRDKQPELLLPSHGAPMTEAMASIRATIGALKRFHQVRHGQAIRTADRMSDELFRELTPHLLMNCRTGAHSYVLLSKSGKALFIDYGYEYPGTGAGAGSDRSSRRPLLFTIGVLKEKYGVKSVDVVLPTHYHDDHVAGCNVLRDAEGTQVWAADNFADQLEYPERQDLPCLWYDPIPVDRRLPLDVPLAWEEYELTLFELGGHTLYAAAISFVVDGKKVVAIGDQQPPEGLPWNYVYRNDFRAADYRKSGELLDRLRPDLILSGHWEPLWVEPGYTEQLIEYGIELERSHEELLPTDELNYGVSGYCATMSPFQITASSGETITLVVNVVNPDVKEADIAVELVLPVNWRMNGPRGAITLAAGASGAIDFAIRLPDGAKGRRQWIVADLTVGGRRLGQQADMVVHIT